MLVTAAPHGTTRELVVSFDRSGVLVDRDHRAGGMVESRDQCVDRGKRRDPSRSCNERRVSWFCGRAPLERAARTTPGCRVTVIVGYPVGGTPDHNVMSPDWLNVPTGTRMRAAFFSHAS